VQVAANAVAPDGDEFFGLREVQHKLRGSEPKSRGTGPVTAIAVRGEWRRAGWLERLWGRSESLIVEHHHGYIMWNGRVEWYPVRSPSLVEWCQITRHGFAPQMDGWCGSHKLTPLHSSNSSN
jgi:hypothetical protein